MQNENYRINLIKEYEAASDNTYFRQNTVAALRNCSIATVERDRWAGIGIPFIKINKAVRYRKRDIHNWLSTHQVFHSTAEVTVLTKKDRM